MIVSNKVLRLVIEGSHVYYYIKEFLTVKDPVKEIKEFYGNDIVGAYTGNWFFDQRNGVELAWIVIGLQVHEHDKVCSSSISELDNSLLCNAYRTIVNGTPLLVNNEEVFTSRSKALVSALKSQLKL